MSVLLIDISVWNGPINAETAWSRGVRGVIIKASDANKVTGIPYTDLMCYEHYDNFLSHGKMLVGMYHYFQPKHDPLMQAQHFAGVVKALSHNNRLLAVDLEEEDYVNNEPVGPGITPGAYANKVKTFLDEVERITGIKCTIYTRMEYFNRCVEKRIFWSYYPDTKEVYPLWVARHNPDWPGPWLNSDPPTYKPRPGEWLSGWSLWQKSGKGNGLGPYFGSNPYLSNDMDVNEFCGDEAALLNFASIQVPEPPLPEPIPMNKHETSKSSVLTTAGDGGFYITVPENEFWYAYQIGITANQNLPVAYIAISPNGDDAQKFVLADSRISPLNARNWKYVRFSYPFPLPPGTRIWMHANGAPDGAYITLQVYAEKETLA